MLASVPQWGQKENPGCLASCTLALTCKVAISNLWPPRPGSLYIFPIPATIVSIPLSSFRGELKPTLKFSFPSLNLENRHSSRRLFPPVLVTFLCHHLLTLPALSTYHHPTLFLPSFLPSPNLKLKIPPNYTTKSVSSSRRAGHFSWEIPVLPDINHTSPDFLKLKTPPKFHNHFLKLKTAPGFTPKSASSAHDLWQRASPFLRQFLVMISDINHRKPQLPEA